MSEKIDCPLPSPDMRPLAVGVRVPLMPVRPSAPGVRLVSDDTPSRAALLLAFAAIYIIWGSTYLGIRITLETMPPFLMAAARFIFAGSFLFLILKVRGMRWPT